MQVSAVLPQTKALISLQINQGWEATTSQLTNASSSKEANSEEEAWD